MSLSFSASKTGIKRRYYKVYMRETTTAIVAADYDTLAHWNTFLALFTYIGYCENENVSVEINPDDPIFIDEGEEHNLGYQGQTEIKFVQSAVADDTALEDMAGKDCDLLLVSTGGLKFAYFHDNRYKISPKLKSGDVEHTIINHTQKTSAVSGSSGYVHTRAAIPTV